jgi:hypothetical protein
MIPLPLILKKNGFTYTQVLREGKSCIYHQTSGEIPIAFEVFTIKVMLERNVFGKIYPEKEVFPSDEDFGQTAWTCRTLEDAMVRFYRLNPLKPESEV